MLFALPGCVPDIASMTPQSDPPTPSQEQLSQPEAAEISEFIPKLPETEEEFARGEDISVLSSELSKTYLLGAGDVLNLVVWNRPELTIESVTVGPDGVISVPRIGFINVKARNREDVQGEIAQKLNRFYESPEVTLSILEYHNNKAFVLGRVSNPGVVSFPGEGTLLEALSLAGGLPVLEREDASFLQKCAIIRGRDKIIWIDLGELLNNGNMTLNARIRNNDVIFIPESKDELVYVMGEVMNPGAVRLRNRLSYLDAMMLVGGPTTNASMSKTFLIRGAAEQGTVKEINLKAMIETGSLQENFLLQSGDVIFVAASGAGQWNYAFRQVLPSLQVMDLSTSSLERFGVMRELRQKMWGNPTLNVE
jgi:protein involved in polysaccharide export with SLBB domain